MKIALLGYGKMGKAIEEIAFERGHEIVLHINSSNAATLTRSQLQQCDVAIEFTGPEQAVHNLLLCAESNIPVICGSTGWLQQWQTVTQAFKEKNGSLLYASNFSIGVNVFFAINQQLARLLAPYHSYNPQIEEIHHTAKKDAPSGTAITLAEQIIENSATKKSWICNQAAKDNELSITAVRQDPAPGTHIVTWTSPIDDIEIKHTAHNRKGFATGAVIAAEFLKGKTGVFSMKDVLGFT
jgi:4-hydroxy-tetrahydrodipicolinate reductase